MSTVQANIHAVSPSFKADGVAAVVDVIEVLEKMVVDDIVIYFSEGAGDGRTDPREEEQRKMVWTEK